MASSAACTSAAVAAFSTSDTELAIPRVPEEEEEEKVVVGVVVGVLLLIKQGRATRKNEEEYDEKERRCCCCCFLKRCCSCWCCRRDGCGCGGAVKATEATERADERRRSECDECDDARRRAGGGRVARSVLAGKEKRREGRASEAARRIHRISIKDSLSSYSQLLLQLYKKSRV